MTTLKQCVCGGPLAYRKPGTRRYRIYGTVERFSNHEVKVTCDDCGHQANITLIAQTPAPERKTG